MTRCAPNTLSAQERQRLLELHENDCRRCGACCRAIPLNNSPREIRESYLRWFNQSGTHIDAIWLLYPMLAGRCQGVDDNGMYIYGPCRMLEGDSCILHDHKSDMCARYPYYGTWGPNAGNIKGCAYKQDPETGMTVAEWLEDLKPVPEDQR